MEHYQFITTTDRKSLYTRIKGLVSKAKEVANEELEVRRQELQALLEYEDKIYEEEFANKVKSRIDEDIKERNQILVKIKEENEKNALEFLESKRIQQYMENCNEIREALRHKEQQNIKECQLEQILENERAKERQQNLDKYWQRVQQVEIDRADEHQRNEDCLKKKLMQQVKDELDIQVMEMKAKRDEERLIKEQEIETLNKLLEQIRLEKFDQELKPISKKTLQYRQELLDSIAKNRQQRCAEAREQAEEHIKMMKEIQRLDAQELLENQQRKLATNRSMQEYIAYSKRMRQFEGQQQKMRDDRIDDLLHVDICTKNNIQQQRARKAEQAALCHAKLQQQICEERERRVREEQERRECKILENRFVHEEITREQILAQRRKNREELDKQVAELKRIRAAEHAKEMAEITPAINDPAFCQQLAEQYIRDGVDYLRPHANWRLLACPKKIYTPKDNNAKAGGDFNNLQLSEQEIKFDSCIKPCGQCGPPIPTCSGGGTKQKYKYSTEQKRYNKWQ